MAMHFIHIMGNDSGGKGSFGDVTTHSHHANHPIGIRLPEYYVGITTVCTKGCSDSMVRQILVYHLPDTEFSADPLAGCIPMDVLFTDLSSLQDKTIS